ncbi:MAG: DUF371 domain-containing protein [Candidatus Aenigmarchaeota archaeon]|nr:DUF371 domain-containing protein [Candidatus Aenigmarchaeota archaeon]
MIERITAYGHNCVTSKHDTTLELTKDKNMTWEGHCIVGVKSDKSCYDLSDGLKKAIMAGKRITIKLKSGEASDTLIAYGHPLLTLKDRKDIVIRKSGFVDDRTLAVHATKSSNSLDRELVRNLKNPRQKLEITIEY